MTERISPEPSESRSEREPVLFEDMLQLPVWPQFIYAAETIEEEAAMCVANGDAELLSELIVRSATIAGELGYEYLNQPSHIYGCAYAEGAQGMSDAEPQILDSRQATFISSDLRYINQRWQVVLEMALDEALIQSGADMSKGQAVYYFPASTDSLLSFYVAPNMNSDDDYSETDDEVTVREIHDLTSDAMVRIASPDFPTLDAAAQREILYDYTSNLDACLPSNLQDEAGLIGCTGLYREPQDMPGFWRYDYHDFADNLQPLAPFVVIGFCYPELAEMPDDASLQPGMFLHDGAPCLQVYDDDEGVMHYIPAPAIRIANTDR